MSDNNIILVSIDCLRADCISNFPNKQLLSKYSFKKDMVKTPTLDSLIEQGTLFTNCFTASSYTTASHAAIATGFYPINNGVQEYFSSRIMKKTIFEIVKENNRNYFTLFQTDFPFILGKHLGFDRKIDFYSCENELKSIRILKEEKKKKNFLAFFHFGNVHTPYGFSSIKNDGIKFIDEVKRLSKKYKINSSGGENSEWLEKDRSRRENILRERYHKAIDSIYSSKNYSELFQMYCKGVSYFDQNRFCNFMEALKESGIFDDSVVIIFSDHGERWEEDSHGHHDNLYDDTTRVPLIIVGGDSEKGKIINVQVRTIDIAPTAMSLIDKRNKIKFDGNRLIPLNGIEHNSAIGEIWTCQDVDNIKKIMQKTKERGRFVASNDEGFLWKEYIRGKNYKIINEYKNKKKSSKIFDIRNGGESIIDVNNEEITNMKKDLLLYRKKKTLKKTIRCNSEDSTMIKNDLKSLGYNV